MPEAFDPLALARHLLRSIRAATLATLSPPPGFPLATLTAIATDHDGAPVLLASQLSAHTRNLDADGRCGLLLAQGGRGDPLAHPRLSLQGRAARAEGALRARLRKRYLAQNPKASLYADFGDFSFWRVDLEAVALNGGFGKAASFSGAELLAAVPEGLADAEPEMLEALNRQPTALARLAAAEGEGPWRAAAIDSAGLTLICGERTARAPFAAAATLDAVRRRLAGLGLSG